MQTGDSGCLISSDFKEFFDFADKIDQLREPYDKLSTEYKIRELIKLENIRPQYVKKLKRLEYLNELKDYDVLLKY